MIPVWFFVGILLIIYGLVIFISGIYWFINPIDIIIGYLHADIWWGLLMMIIGSYFLIKNYHRKKRTID